MYQRVCEKKQSAKLSSSGHGRILFVDDGETNRIIGHDVLQSLGYEVILAENGKDSIDIFQNEHTEIDIVIMDMIMPIMHGSEAFLKMKEIDNNCKVIISSGYTRDENLDELLEAGLCGTIQKTYKISEISELLRKSDSFSNCVREVLTVAIFSKQEILFFSCNL